MAKQAKKFRKVIRDLEVFVGHPVLAVGDDGDDEPSAVFVSVFGKAEGSNQTRVLGGGQLTLPKVVLADLDTVAELKDAATPTLVGFAWVQGSQHHTQVRSVLAFGPRDTDSPNGTDMWAIELEVPSTAPIHSNLPPGASPASGWCILFPFLSFCKSH